MGLLSPGPALDIADSDPELMRWLSDRGLPQQKVAVQQLPGQGRGLVARTRLGKGELLLRVPMGLVVSEASALQGSPLLRRLVGGRGLPSWTVLALWLAEQRALARAGGGSEWAPYLAALPERPGTVLDWREGEVDRWLVGGLRAKAGIILAADAATWHEVAPLIAAAEADGAAPRGALARESVRWGVGQLLSRSVRLDAAGGDTVLVPFADFANHSVGADCFLDYDARSGTVAVALDRAYSPGEQVFISYGPKSSGELLLSYGFAPPPGSNACDAAFLEVGLPQDGGGGGGAEQRGEQQQGRQQRQEGGRRRQQRQQQQGRQQQREPQQEQQPTGAAAGEDELLAAKRAAMAARDVPDSECFGVRLDALPEGLLSYLAFVDAPIARPEEAEPLAEALLSRGELPDLPGIGSCEALAFEGLARRCREALKAYKQDPAEDKRLAETVPDGGGFDRREALCASIRVRERAILARTEFVAAQRAKALQGGRRR
ncbi:hypothetical protein Rsub_07891 [Raphidocelis subcapitata]|uniref:SET domain-containing protein n=1 Tax=Raphidocelis subcapitata TaxID=307507 RepID=A0A2V0P5P4_9CHLO|nr:hypothetical protein Rsub_07891 [Raphidocelis subcapitata]|eukprot:GBF95178.1 hypothetical protein Rsub_07891 [Raphidocelis subcapitata]